MVAWDNLPRGATISCPVIEKSLTSPTISDRLLGVSEQVTVPATTIQFFTGNNILSVGDMASRSFVIRLDVDRPDPENRRFQHPDPLKWTLDHRARILRGLYTLLVWGLQQRTAAKEPTPAKTRFKTWWTLCGAPVEAVAGIDFAEILRARESEGDDVSAMQALLLSLEESFDGAFTADQVASLTRSDPNEISVHAALEAATGKPFGRGYPDALMIGKRLQSGSPCRSTIGF
jgi:hypothetical protein